MIQIQAYRHALKTCIKEYMHAACKLHRIYEGALHVYCTNQRMLANAHNNLVIFANLYMTWDMLSEGDND